MNPILVVLLTGIFTATACALIGTFLLLRRMAMMADAISHAILPGLVAGYFIARGPNLWIGALGAAGAGVLTVVLVEILLRSGRVKRDAAIGLVFPALFALGTFLVSKFFANVHLDTDAILYGEIALAPFDLLIISGYSVGPQPLYVLGGLTIINLAFVLLFYKELKLATFDAAFAATIGFSPVVLHYALMTMVSLTTVGAFTAVGAILVVAFLIVPPATAYLLTDRLPMLIVLSVLIGIVAAVMGYALAMVLDASIAGAMATVAGICFALALLFAPHHGLLAKALRRVRQRRQFATEVLVVHLAHHEGTPQQAQESSLGHLQADLRWTAEFAAEVVQRAAQGGLVRRENGHLELTSDGRMLAQRVIAR
ncbi:MAG TPA: metal ABC transporter permease [Herpetosiphonaceae bacterium]